MTKTKTPKQAMLAHLNEMHTTQYNRVPKGRLRTLWDLQRWHARQHHQFSPNHHHGVTTGPNDRPIGWWTGEGAIPNDLKPQTR